MTHSLNDLAFSEISLGLSDSFQIKLTEEMVNSFLKLSGDFNPLHADESYAQNTPFGKRVVPGMLLSSFFSRLVGMHLPGKQALYLSQQLQFKKPAFIGDAIVVTGTVQRISIPLRIITMQTQIARDGTSTVLVDGECRVQYR